MGFGPKSRVDLVALHQRWYRARFCSRVDDQPTEGGADADPITPLHIDIDDTPPLWLFVMGANYWRFESEWPLPQTVWRPLYLHHNGGLTWSSPPSPTPQQHDHEMALSFVYDPHDPCPSLGAQFQAKTRAGPRDRRSLAAERSDVLVFESEVLRQPLEIVGPVTAVLYVSSTAVDTDFTAALCDVQPDGSAASLCEGICRTRYRHNATAQPWEGWPHGDAEAEYRGTAAPEMMEAGGCYEIRVDMWDTAVRFGVGHRIRLDVSSSNFPRYATSLCVRVACRYTCTYSCVQRFFFLLLPRSHTTFLPCRIFVRHLLLAIRRYDRNLNTGGRIGFESEAEAIVATQTIRLSSQYPSRLVLPVVPYSADAESESSGGGSRL
eukprot:COSAG05_NODE_1293_length_5260_cov_2.373571_7_plen_379_part_00